MIQDILTYTALLIALLFLWNRYFRKPSKKDSGCDSDCKCGK